MCMSDPMPTSTVWLHSHVRLRLLPRHRTLPPWRQWQPRIVRTIPVCTSTNHPANYIQCDEINIYLSCTFLPTVTLPTTRHLPTALLKTPLIYSEAYFDYREISQNNNVVYSHDIFTTCLAEIPCKLVQMSSKVKVAKSHHVSSEV